MSKKLRKEHLELKIREAGSGKYEFIGWSEPERFGTREKVVVRCIHDGYEWTSRFCWLVNDGRGCSTCSGRRVWKKQERREQINSIVGVEFIAWHGEYKNSFSRVMVRCDSCGYEWTPTINRLINQRNGCPMCCTKGFQINKKGTLYALRSECGSLVKVGVSNKPKRRHSELMFSTPFQFTVIEQISGNGDRIAELEKYFHNKYERAGLSGFDGATEWLICTDELLTELRTIKV